MTQRARGRAAEGRLGAGATRPGLPSPQETDRQTDRQTPFVCWTNLCGSSVLGTRVPPPGSGPAGGMAAASPGLAPLGQEAGFSLGAPAPAQARRAGRDCRSEAGPGCWDGEEGQPRAQPGREAALGAWTGGVSRLAPPGAEGQRGCGPRAVARRAPDSPARSRSAPSVTLSTGLRPGSWPSPHSSQLGTLGTGRSLLPAPETLRRYPFTSPLVPAPLPGVDAVPVLSSKPLLLEISRHRENNIAPSPVSPPVPPFTPSAFPSRLTV